MAITVGKLSDILKSNTRKLTDGLRGDGQPLGRLMASLTRDLDQVAKASRMPHLPGIVSTCNINPQQPQTEGLRRHDSN